MAIVPYRRIADALAGAETPEERRRVGNLIDRDFDSLEFDGGATCSCEAIVLYSNTFATSGTGIISVSSGSAGTTSSQWTDWSILEGGDGWSFDGSYIVPPNPGLFAVSAWAFLDPSSGSSNVQVQLTVTNSSAQATVYNASYSPSGFGVRVGASGIVGTSADDPNIGSFLGLVAGTGGATRAFDAQASFGGVFLTIVPICGCGS